MMMAITSTCSAWLIADRSTSTVGKARPSRSSSMNGALSGSTGPRWGFEAGGMARHSVLTKRGRSMAEPERNFMEPLPRGANFVRAKMLWEIGLDVAGDLAIPYGGNRDMCITVGSGGQADF